MIKTAALLSLFVIGTGGNCMASDWPPLPSKGFIVGRAANFEDVNRGNAVFVLAIEKPIAKEIIGKPLPIRIPQYAVWRESNTRVIVVQAEEANGVRYIGARTLDGKDVIGMDGDLELLGTEPANK